jgi:hypothetical protein
VRRWIEIDVDPAEFGARCVLAAIVMALAILMGVGL